MADQSSFYLLHGIVIMWCLADRLAHNNSMGLEHMGGSRVVFQKLATGKILKYVN